MKYLIRRAPLNSSLVILLLSLLASTLVYSQRRPAQRPKLQQMRRDYFAGKFLLIPHDYRQVSVQQPTLVAQIADHDLMIPAERLLDDPEKLNSWASGVDFDEIDGAIVSLDTLAGNPDSARARERLSLIRELRARRRGVPIYAFTDMVSATQAAGPIVQSAVEMVADGSIDFLLVREGGGSGGASQGQSLPAKLRDVIAARRLTGRVAFIGNLPSAAMTLLTRMLNQRFGFVPKIYPVVSSKSAGAQQIVRMVSAEIRKIDGAELAAGSVAQRGVDTLLFIQTPQTSETERAALVDAIAQTINRNVRVAVLDLSESKESKDALVAELRRRKLIDQLATYASSDIEDERDRSQVQSEALTRALAQASSFLVSIRFLRDDLERVRRLDRAQSSLTLSRLLTDWAFPLHVRPKLQAYISEQTKDSPDKLDQNGVETFALNETKSIATELFNEQLLRNVHAILLSNGERAQFENRLLQRVQLRLAPDWRRRLEAEVRATVYLVHLGNQPSIQAKQRSLWELTNERVDESVGRRWASIEWQNFATDVENVEMSVKISEAASTVQSVASESYSIVSKRARQARRIEITAPSSQGAFYALSRLEQMGAEGQLAQDFQLNEAPALARRGLIENPRNYWSHRDRLDALRTLGRLRLNRFYSSAGADWRSSFTDRESEKLKELLHVADENFVQFVYFVDFAPSQNSATEQDLSMLEQRLKLLASLGVKSFAITSIPAHAVDSLRDRLRAVRNDVEVLAWPASLTKPAIVCLEPQFVLSSLTVADSIGLVVSPAIQREASLVGLAVVAEYAWGARKFDAPRAFDLMLKTLFDERSRAGVRVLARALGDCGGDEKNAAGELEAGLPKQKAAELQAALESITGTRERGLLRGELAKLINQNNQ